MKIRIYLYIIISFVLNACGSQSVTKQNNLLPYSDVNAINSFEYNSLLQNSTNFFGGTQTAILLDSNIPKLLVTLIPANGSEEFIKVVATFLNIENSYSSYSFYANKQDLLYNNASICNQSKCLHLASLKVVTFAGEVDTNSANLDFYLTSDLSSKTEKIFTVHKKTIDNTIDSQVSTENKIYKYTSAGSTHYLRLQGPLVEYCKVNSQFNITKIDANFRLNSTYSLSTQLNTIYFPSLNITDFGNRNFNLFNVKNLLLNNLQAFSVVANPSSDTGATGCLEAWNSRLSTSLLTNLKITDMYNKIWNSVLTYPINELTVMSPKQLYISNGNNLFRNFFSYNKETLKNSLYVGASGYDGYNGQVYRCNLDDNSSFEASECDAISSLNTGGVWGAAVYVSGQNVFIGATGATNSSGIASGVVYKCSLDGITCEVFAEGSAVNASFGSSLNALGDYLYIGSRGYSNSKGAVYKCSLIQKTCTLMYTGTYVNDSFGSSLLAVNGALYVGAYSALGGSGAIYNCNLNPLVMGAICSTPVNTGVVTSLQFGQSLALNDNNLFTGAAFSASIPGKLYSCKTDGTECIIFKSGSSTSTDAFGRSVVALSNDLFVGAIGVNANKGAFYKCNIESQSCDNVSSNFFNSSDSKAISANLGASMSVYLNN